MFPFFFIIFLGCSTRKKHIFINISFVQPVLTNRKVYLSSLLNALADFWGAHTAAKHKKKDLHTFCKLSILILFLHIHKFRPNCFPIHMLTTFFFTPPFHGRICELLETHKAHFSLLAYYECVVLSTTPTKMYMPNTNLISILLFSLGLALSLVYIQSVCSKKSLLAKNPRCINFYPFCRAIFSRFLPSFTC